jgi:predicted NUDIX family NTP pyrophosphohydrolase
VLPRRSAGARYGEKVKTSAGILLYRRGQTGLEVLIGHMGGPFWERRDAGAWSIPKGETKEGESLLAVAKREFEEELGSPPPDEPYLELGEVKQANGKRVTVFAVEGDLDAERIRSNSFELEWPRDSGQMCEFPEIDRAAWVSPAEARRTLIPAQVQFVERLESALSSGT